MKTFGKILAIILFFIVFLIPFPYWDKYTSNQIIISLTQGINGMFCGIIAASVIKSFYKWFVSKIKED